MRAHTRFVLLGALLSVPVSASAQDTAVPVEEIQKVAEPEAEDVPKEGWTLKLRFGGNFNLTDARNFVGSEDGTTVQIGLIFEGSAFFKAGQHHWNNELSIQHNQTLTPQLDRFVKSFDLLDFKSTYIYKLKNPEWLGPFARFALQTPVLPFDVVRVDPFQVVDEAGNDLSGVVASGDTFELTGAFEPLQLRQSIGLFGDPIKEQAFNLEFQVGFGVQEIIAREGFSIQDEAEDSDLDGDGTADGILITARELTSVLDLGVEAEVRMQGDIVKDTVYWNFLANAFWAGTTYSFDSGEFGSGDFADQMNLKLKGAIGVKLAEWLEAEYTLNVIRQPAILDEFQVQNGFQLVVTYALL
jgi:hypothetical protein